MKDSHYSQRHAPEFPLSGGDQVHQAWYRCTHQESSAELTWQALQYHEQICGDAQHLLQLMPGDGLRIGKTISAGKLPLQCHFCGAPTRLVDDNQHQSGCPDSWQGHNDKWPAPAQLRPCDVGRY